MNRLVQLLLLLKDNKYTSAEVLARELNVSSRTIYNDIIKLNEYLKDNSAKIITKPNKGSILKINEIHNYKEFKKEFCNKKENTDFDVISRIHQIMEYLIVNNKPVKLDDLAEMMYVSRSTMKSDIKLIREKLKGYNVQLNFKSSKGLLLEGDEKSYRLALAHLKQHQEVHIFEDNEVTKIKDILERVIQKYKFVISEYSLYNLCIHIYTAIARIEANCPIIINENINELLETDNDLEMTIEIVKVLEKEYNVQFSKDEIYYMLMHLSSKKIVELTSLTNQNTAVTDDIYKIVIQMLKEIDKTFKIDFSFDLELITLLSLHMIPFTYRIKYNLTSQNPMKDKIRDNYMLAYNMASVASGILYAEYNKEISQDEIAYMALHFNVALERKRNKKKMNVLIVCSTGRGMAELLAYQIKEQFGSNINVIQSQSSYNLNKYDFKNIDFILTTVTITDKVPVPIIELKYFLDKYQVEEVNKILDKKQKKEILNFFTPELFFSNLSFKTKEEVITFLCNQVDKIKKVDKNFLQLVLKREMVGTTELGNLVSIPHPNNPVGKESFISIGILEKPIIWEKEKVQIIFLLSMKEKGDEKLQDFYKIVSRILHNSSYVNRLINKGSYKELLSIIQELCISMK